MSSSSALSTAPPATRPSTTSDDLRGSPSPRTAPSRALRVLFFDPYPHAFGGSQRVMLRQALCLQERRVPVAVMLPSGGSFFDELTAAGIAPLVVPAPPALSVFGRQTTGSKAVRAAASLPAYWARLARAMRSWGPTIVHVNDHRGGVLAAVPARLAGAKLVWHAHSLQPGTALTTALRMASHGVVVPSRAVLTHMPAAAHRTKVHVLANPAPDFGELPPLPSGARLVTIARLHPDKGLDVLLRALAELRAAAQPDAELVILGSPQTGWEQYPAKLRYDIHELGLDGAVTFAGQVSEVAPALFEAAVYVQPSRPRTEVMPLAILEAMAAGRPIVATAVGAVPELLEDGVSGVLVQPEDAAALTAALTEVLADRTGAAALGAAARQRARTVFGGEAFADNLESIYAAVLAA